MSTKKALLVGINYIGTSSELYGCINDVLNVKEQLLKYGFKEDDITLLTDLTEVKPTRVNIIRYLLDLILSGATNLYFHYSGHGTQSIDVSTDERDKRDEAICPIDYTVSGLIIDDELRGLLSCAQTGQNLFAVFDSCNSGTCMDLAYTLFQKVGTQQYTLVRDALYHESRANIVLFSGCLDTQTSADTVINDQPQGAMTGALLDSLKKGYTTYDALIRNLRTYLKTGGYSQTATFSTGRLINLNSKLSILQ